MGASFTHALGRDRSACMASQLVWKKLNKVPLAVVPPVVLAVPPVALPPVN